MAIPAGNQGDMQVIRDPKDFDRNSGIWFERFIFNHRLPILLICLLATVFWAWQASKLPVNASFEKMIPQSHPYIQNYFQNKDALRGMGNSVRVVVENTQGNIFDKDFLETLQKASDTLFLMPGVDRSALRSLWTSSLRWTEVTEEGYRGGPVMPDPFDGSAAAMDALRGNILQSGIVGNYVASDFRSSLIIVPLMDKNQDTNLPLDYNDFSHQLESKVRVLETDKIKIHIVGFAKLVGDLIDGLWQVSEFFAFAAAIAALFVFLYTRCIRSTLLLVFYATLGVCWLLGILSVIGYVLDPYLILVPFLIFAIGLSHGAQKMNGIMQDIGRGTHKYVAARYTFRRLFRAGLTALLANVVGFAVLIIIDIPVIKELAISMSIGVGILIFTILVLVPVSLSYVGVSKSAAERSIRQERGEGTSRFWEFFASFIQRGRAIKAVSVAVLLAIGGFVVGTQLKIGDLDAGAPELRPDSRYNKDVRYLTQHYALSSDMFVVMMKTPEGGCQQFSSLVEADRMSNMLRQVPGVQMTMSAADSVRMVFSGQNEGSPKWLSIPRNPSNLNGAIEQVQVDKPELVDRRCSVTPIVAYLQDHKADTLERVVKASEAFATQHDTDDRQFQLAAGSAGIEAVTNIVVERANLKMLLALYATVTLLCLIAFRNWKAAVIAVVPLFISTLLCEALMVALGIGMKVATLPAITLGVGIGVDYALYLLSVQLQQQRAGQSLLEAYRHALQFTGRVVALVGLTLAAGVVTWVWSPIKFQADMGILLTFLFLGNMVGALILIPAMSYFLLRGPVDFRSDDVSASGSDELATAEASESKPIAKVPNASVY
ncbi:RND family transporter [Pseudomonas sp. MIACH]|uniref:efflux RND transporter permease subunit n=1 Tax=Pseudomonas sp. MIACH TaxID=1078355 RepID=UPI0009E93458|nr:MMPL family transporter [Pseudomonas sp. MIACH]